MGTNSEKIEYDKSPPLQKKLAETDICKLSFKEWLIKKQLQMTTTMRRKESKPTFDTLYIIPWLQATAIYTSKQSLIKNRVLKFALWRASLRALLCPYIILTQALSAFICGWKKMGRLGSVGETIFGVHSSFFVFMVLRLINHSSMIDQNKQCESRHSSFNRLKHGQSLFVQQEKDHTHWMSGWGIFIAGSADILPAADFCRTSSKHTLQKFKLCT